MNNFQTQAEEILAADHEWYNNWPIHYTVLEAGFNNEVDLAMDTKNKTLLLP